MSQLKKLQSYLDSEKAGALISSPLNIFYLSGFETGSHPDVKVGSLHGDGLIFITPKSSFLLTDPRYSGISIPGFEVVIFNGRDRLNEIINFLVSNTKLIFIEKSGLSYLEGSKLIKKLANNKIQIKDISRYLMESRESKEEYEIEMIEKAQKITDVTFTKIIKHIKTGITEIEVASKIKLLMASVGADLAFETIVAFGKNSATAHHHSGNQKLKRGDVILIDFGARIDRYHSDMTRTVFFQEINPFIKNAYEKVLESLLETEKLIKREKSIKKISEFSASFLREFKEASFENYHALGHGVGLEIHETPGISKFNNNVLKNNSIITLEPSVYFKNKFGIRIEDMILIGKKTKVLTNSSKNLMILN